MLADMLTFLYVQRPETVETVATATSCVKALDAIRSNSMTGVARWSYALKNTPDSGD